MLFQFRFVISGKLKTIELELWSYAAPKLANEVHVEPVHFCNWYDTGSLPVPVAELVLDQLLTSELQLTVILARVYIAERPVTASGMDFIMSATEPK